MFSGRSIAQSNNIHNAINFNTNLCSGSRESALMHAFGSSAIAFTLAKYCSSGLIANCECDESEGFDDVVSAFEWSACSDNVVNGVAFAEAFMKSWDLKSWRTKRHLEIQRKGARWRQLTKILTNLRNNAAGTNVSWFPDKVLPSCLRQRSFRIASSSSETLLYSLPDIQVCQE